MIKGNLIIHSDFDFFSALMIIHGSAIREEGLQWGEIAIERAFFLKVSLFNCRMPINLGFTTFEFCLP